MHQLTYELKQLADTYREGSYATQHNRVLPISALAIAPRLSIVSRSTGTVRGLMRPLS